MAGRHLKLLKGRTRWLLAVFGLLYLAISARLFYIQVLDNERYRALADEIRLRRRPTPANRGIVYDRLGRELATNVPACALCAYPMEVRRDERGEKVLRQRLSREQMQTVAEQVSALTDIERSAIQRALASRRTFVYLSRQLPPEVGDRIRQANLPGVGVLREPRRFYPSCSLAAHVIGFTDVDGRGVEGIERVANTYLTGKEGYVIGEIDSSGRIIPETMRGSVPPVDGNDVALTIDAYLQHVTEEALEKSFSSHGAVGASAIVMDPHTGEILALANFPTFNPNSRGEAARGAWRNRAVTDLYEPGSTLKLVTVAAGAEEGIPVTETVATCTKSGMQIGRRRVRCSLHAPYLAGHGSVDMFRIIRCSCNIGAASVARRLGPEKLYSYLKSFGLLDRPGSGMAGEAVFGLDEPESWPEIKLANVGFGQGIAVSPLQMACAYSVIASGGKLVQPRIIREIRDKDGNVVRSFGPRVVRQVISPAAASKVRDMLVGCVDEGTGKTSKVDGYSVAGKTGSAEKPSTTGRGYAAGKFIASFMGFIPARSPKLVICVVVDEPKGTHWGATVAAPVFKEIAQKAMWYLRVPPDEQPEPDQTVPAAPTNVRRTKDRFGAGYTG